MKITYLFTLVILFSGLKNYSVAQSAHSFFSTNNQGVENDALVFSTTQGDLFCTSKNSSTDNLVLVFGEIDSDGETTEYTSVEVAGMIGNTFVVSGYAYENDEVLIAVLSDRLTSCDLIHIRFNRSTNTVVEATRYPEDFRRGFVRSRQKGNQLITYIATSGNELVRIAKDVTNISSGSIEVIDPSETYTAGLTTPGRKMIELLIDPNGNEFVQKENKLYKRQLNQNVDTLMMGAWQSLNGYDLVISANGRLNVFSSSLKFNQIDTAALSILNSGDLSNTSFLSIPNLAVVAVGNGFRHYCTASNGYMHIYDIDQNYVVTNHVVTDYKLKVFDIQELGPEFLLTGKKIDAGSLASVALFKSSLSNTTPFYFEYNSIFTHKALKAHTAHLNVAFRDLNNEVAGLKYTFSNQERSVIYNASTGLVGMNNSMEARGVLAGYNIEDYLPGPYTPNGNSIEAFVSYDKHNRSYYVDRDMIDYHRLNYGQASYEMPFGIKQWPAHGDPSLGQSLNVASFFDENNNGIYEPEFGEYPWIYGDRCYLTVYHVSDSAYSSDVSDTPIDVLRYIYMFDCDTSEALNNTIFMRSDFRLLDGEMNDSYAGIYVDGDLGNYSDDYIGTHVGLGMLYNYNSDNFDESSGGNIGFQDTLSASGIMLLKGAKASPDLIDNNAGVGPGLTVNGFGYGDGIADNEFLGLSSSLYFTNASTYPYADPSNLSQAYYGYQGLYADGSPQTLGSTNVAHIYFNDSDPQFYSSNGVDPGTTSTEYSPTPWGGGDRRILGGSGPYSMNANDPSAALFSLHTAYLVAVDTLAGAVSDYTMPLDLLFDLGSAVKAKFNSNEAGCGKSFDAYVSPIDIAGISESNFEFALYPNPVSNELNIRTNLTGELDLKVYTISGTLIFNGNIQAEDKIQTAGWESGVYLVEMSNGFEKLTRKLVKY